MTAIPLLGGPLRRAADSTGETALAGSASRRGSGQTRLAECLAFLRGIRHELDKERKWLDARAVRLDSVIGDLDLFLGSLPDAAMGPARRPTWRHPRGGLHSVRHMVVSTVKITQRGDGDCDVYLDSLIPFQLSPLLARLLALLAEDAGHDVSDGLVGFKTNAHLIAGLRRLSPDADQKLRIVSDRLSARSLAQTVYALREKLASVVIRGDLLVQTSRGRGRRIAVRRPARIAPR